MKPLLRQLASLRETYPTALEAQAAALKKEIL